MPEGQVREPEVWRSPVFAPKTVRPAPPPRHDNDQLVADIAKCGWLQPGFRTLDATWGRGIWWKKWRPDRMVAMDAFQPKLEPLAAGLDPKAPTPGAWPPEPVRADFRRPPFRAESFDQIAYDPPYKLNGKPTDEVDERYGVDVAAKWQNRFRLALDGIAWWPPCPLCRGGGMDVQFQEGLYEGSEECDRCDGSGRLETAGLAPLLRKGGILVAKGMDQVVSQEVRWMATEMQRRAEAAGLLLVDRFDLPGYPRPQDENRGQDHARQNVSFALVFERPRGRKRPIVWTA